MNKYGCGTPQMSTAGAKGGTFARKRKFASNTQVVLRMHGEILQVIGGKHPISYSLSMFKLTSLIDTSTIA